MEVAGALSVPGEGDRADEVGARLARTHGAPLTDADLWVAVKAAPLRAPAALALAAVARFAESSGQQARWLRETYPSVAPDRLARVAHRSAAGRVRLATIVGLPVGGLTSAPVQMWAHTRMILEIAAIYQVDPGAPARAADVLTLLRIYPDYQTSLAAVEAVATAQKGTPTFAVEPRGVALSAVLRAARRVARRLIPGSTLVLDGLAATTTTDDVFSRAIRFYRG